MRFHGWLSGYFGSSDVETKPHAKLSARLASINMIRLWRRGIPCIVSHIAYLLLLPSADNNWPCGFRWISRCLFSGCICDAVGIQFLSIGRESCRGYARYHQTPWCGLETHLASVLVLQNEGERQLATAARFSFFQDVGSRFVALAAFIE